MLPRFALGVLLLSVLALGCGESETSSKPLTGEERAVATALRQYVRALSFDDFKRACALTTPQARSKRRPTCIASLRRAFGAAYTPEDATSFRVRSVEVTGGRAVATTNNKDRTQTPLRKIAGSWLVGG